MLRRPTEGEDIAADYRHFGLTPRPAPARVAAGAARRLPESERLARWPISCTARACPFRRARHHAATALECVGVIFVTLEDETGYLNLVVWERLAQSEPGESLLGATLLRAYVGTCRRRAPCYT